jgi:hypothetical protein
MLLFCISPDLTRLEWRDPYTRTLVGSVPAAAIHKISYGSLTNTSDIYQPWHVFSVRCEGRTRLTLHIHAPHKSDVFKWVLGLQAFAQSTEQGPDVPMSMRSHTVGSLLWKYCKLKLQVAAARHNRTLLKHIRILATGSEIEQ